MKIRGYQGLGGEGSNKERLLNWDRDFLWGDENDLELNRGGGWTTS